MITGRPLKFKSADDLQKKVDEFFLLVKKGEESPSVIALAVHLDVDKKTLINYQNPPDPDSPNIETLNKFKVIIDRAKEKVECLFTQEAYRGNIPPNIFIFTAKNHYDYQDKQELNHGGQIDNPLKMILNEIDGKTSDIPSNRD